MTRASALALLMSLTWSGCVPDTGRPARASGGSGVYQRLLDAEDSRPAGGEALQLLVEATGDEDAFVRRTAVRALGRLEDPSLSATLVGHLDDADPRVRSTAVEALAQSVHGSDGMPVLGPLLARVGIEAHAAVNASLARSLGRLRLDAPGRRRVVDALVELGEGGSAPEETLVGVALGFESLVRLSEGDGLSRPAADLLVALMRHGAEREPSPAGDGAGRIRALAAAALGPSRRLSLGLIDSALSDPEPAVRRAVIPYLAAAPPARRDGLLARALTDSAATVRIAAVRYLDGLSRTAPRCENLMAAAAPGAQASVRIVALEALARDCPNFSAQRSALIAAAEELQGNDAWQPAARALLSLAAVDAEAARRLLPRYASHENAFVRTWAARTATAVRHTETLFDLVMDRDANVRTAALPGLFAVEGHGLDDFLLRLLSEDDPQLLMTVAGLLEGAPERTVVAGSLLTAFERVAEAERETWRDPRLALLERVAELGDASLTDRLTPFLEDYDPVVAGRVSSLLEGWTGRPQPAAPVPLPRAEVPTRVDLRALEGATLTLQTTEGALVIELLPDQAPTNVTRVARLSESGYYDGLTFHRWAPNFVVQGGSPNANEYQGDGPYTRDEVGGLPHWRGTVGISTRGRDTGDGQIFLNLVDNPRLNYDYTVIGRLLEGFDVLDRILEGTVIQHAVVSTGD